MPEIYRCLGIVVAMYYREHTLPHFHLRYAEHRASFALDPVRLLQAGLRPRAVGLVMEWAARHAEEPRDDWSRASRWEPLRRIAPLE